MNNKPMFLIPSGESFRIIIGVRSSCASLKKKVNKKKKRNNHLELITTCPSLIFKDPSNAGNEQNSVIVHLKPILTKKQVKVK